MSKANTAVAAAPTTPIVTAPAKPDTTAWVTAGRNVKFHTLDGVLFIAVDISEGALKAAPNSTSGKTKSIGSTLGNVAVPGTAVKLGVNVYTPQVAG